MQFGLADDEYKAGAGVASQVKALGSGLGQEDAVRCVAGMADLFID